MKDSILFQNLSLGPYVLRNRIVLPPLTRSRSTQPGNIPNELMATYYQQRAGAGFMVTEGTQIEPRGQGYAWTPGIYSPEQRTLTERSGGNGAVAVFMACYDCFFVQSMPRASKQQARYAVGRCLMLWSSNDVTQQQRCYAAGQSP